MKGPKGKGSKEKTSDVIELAFVKFSEACH